MRSNRKMPAVLATLIVTSLVPQATAQTAAGILLQIEKHAVLTSAGQVRIRIQITCGPFVGVEEFQDGQAGGGQNKTGASSETGIDGTVLCDGVTRVHTAHLSPLDENEFKHGPAGASASLIVCTLEGEEQACFSGSTSRAIIVRGGPPVRT
jgi:hypothetical protein